MSTHRDIVEHDLNAARVQASKVAGAAVSIVALSLLYVDAGARLFGTFPRTYSWSELLISYNGGFVRRGLLGEIGYRADRWVGADLGITGLLVLSYIAVATIAVVAVFRSPTLPGFLCLVSPGLLLFPLWDFEAFGRKDILLVLTFALTLLALRRVTSLWRGFSLLVLAYGVAGLVHEIAALYFVAAVVSLLLSRDDDARSQIRILAAAAGAVAAFAIFTVLSNGTESHVNAMIADWQGRYPEAYASRGATDALSLPAQMSYRIVWGQLRHLVTTAGYLAGFVLTGIPVVWLARSRWEAFRATRFRVVLLVIGAGAILAPFGLAADWGRYTYLFWMHAFLFFVLTTPREHPNRRPRLGYAIAAMLLVVVYATSWQVRHWVVAGENPLVPGPLVNEIVGSYGQTLESGDDPP